MNKTISHWFKRCEIDTPGTWTDKFFPRLASRSRVVNIFGTCPACCLEPLNYRCLKIFKQHQKQNICLTISGRGSFIIFENLLFHCIKNDCYHNSRWMSYPCYHTKNINTQQQEASFNASENLFKNELSNVTIIILRLIENMLWSNAQRTRCACLTLNWREKAGLRLIS